jgi:TolB-like protein
MAALEISGPQPAFPLNKVEKQGTLPEHERMDGLGSADIFEFGRFRFDRRGRSLFRLDQEGKAALVPLGGTALGVLEMLVGAHGELVEREKIMQTVWRGKTVEDANLAVQISNLRESIGRRSIQTVSGRGYRFIAPIKQPSANAYVTAPVISQAVTRPRLSIVVLPFTNLSEDRGQQYFADAITDDLTNDLSRIDDTFVISRNTAFTYRDRPADTKQIGRELGVRYVLEGSVRRSGSQVRANVQLIDAAADAHVWADRFDCDAADLLALQGEITGRIAVSLNLELVGEEALRNTDHPNAVDYIYRGRAASYGKLPTDESYTKAIGLLQRALALDPEAVEAQAWLACVLANRALDFPSDASDGDIKRAEELAEKAVAAWPRRPLPHFAKGQALRVQNRCEEAIGEYETVLALNRNWVGAIFAIGWCKFHIGFIEEMLPALERVIRLSPRDPYMGLWYARIGIVHLLQSRIDEAIVWLEKARSFVPSRAYTRANLAAAYALKGEIDRAATELAAARRLSCVDRYSSIARLKAGYFGVPTVRALYEATYFAGLRIARMPED